MVIEIAAAVRARRCPHSRKEGEKVAGKPLQRAKKVVAQVSDDRAIIKNEGATDEEHGHWRNVRRSALRTAKTATTTAKLGQKEVKKTESDRQITSVEWHWSTRACVTNAIEKP